MDSLRTFTINRRIHERLSRLQFLCSLNGNSRFRLGNVCVPLPRDGETSRLRPGLHKNSAESCVVHSPHGLEEHTAPTGTNNPVHAGARMEAIVLEEKHPRRAIPEARVVEDVETLYSKDVRVQPGSLENQEGEELGSARPSRGKDPEDASAVYGRLG